MQEELKRIGAQVGSADSDEALKAAFLALASYMGRNMPYTTVEELESLCKPFKETEAYESMERLVNENAHFDELDEGERVGKSRSENERELQRMIEAYNALDCVDLKLLWFIKACFGGKRDGEMFLLDYFRKKYSAFERVDMRYVVEELDKGTDGERGRKTA